MTNYIKEFIERTADLINNGEWEKLETLTRLPYMSDRETSEFYYTLINAGINPIERLDHIPENFLYNRPIESFEIPDHIKSIGQSSFNHCYELKWVSIPDTVTKIGDFAFFDCKELKKIIFKGTLELWRKIRKGYDWISLSAFNELQCSDTTITL